MNEKPKCAVGGSLAGGRAMCGSIVVGGIFCGDDGECPHQVFPVGDLSAKRCTYPKCNCPFDAPADPNWCARGLPPRQQNGE